MKHRSDLAYSDEGYDLASSCFYAEVLQPSGMARTLPPTIYRSLPFTVLEDAAVWTRDWICVGTHADIPNEGDLLPFTVGTHGLHVQRTAEGLAARFNKAQHGGCRIVPLQCQGGAKTKCSFTSCGYSRDRSAISSGELGDNTPEMHQYLGLRPERLLRAHTSTWGPLIFVNLDSEPDPLAEVLERLGPASRIFRDNMRHRLDERWREYDTNWKLLGEALAHGQPLDSKGDREWLASKAVLSRDVPALTIWLFPNLVMLATAVETCIAILQPTAIGRTLCRMSVWGKTDCSTVFDWNAEIAVRAKVAEAKHTEMANWGTHRAPETMGKPLPLQSSPHELWAQRALANRVLAIPRAAADTPLYSNQRSF